MLGERNPTARPPSGSRPRTARSGDPDGVTLLAAVAAGTLAAPRLGAAALPVTTAGAAFLTMALLGWRGRNRLAGALVLAMLAMTAAAVTGLRAAAVAGGALPRLAAAEAMVTVEGTVAAEPRGLTYGGRLLTLSVRRVRSEGSGWRTRERASVLLPPRTGPLAAGDRLRLRARARPAARTDPLGWRPLVQLDHPVLLHRAPSPNPALRVTEAVRAAAREQALGRLPPERAGLLVAMALGDTSLLRRDVEDAFRAAGLTHLVAVSGANVAAVLSAGLGLAFLLGAGRAALVLVGLPLITGFVLLTRWEPSVLRAGAMAALALVGLAAGYAPGPRRALCLAASVLLLAAPALSASLGFALSVGATAGVLWLGPLLAALLATWLPRWAATAAGVTLGAQTAVVPVLVLTTATLTPAGVPANLLALPLAWPLMVLGVVAALLAPVAPAASGLVCAVADVPLRLLIGIARLAERSGAGELALTSPARGACLLVWVAAVAALAASSQRSRDPLPYKW